MTTAQYEAALGRSLTPIERAAVEEQEAGIERKESWYASLREEFEPHARRREANLAKVRKGLFYG